MKCSQARQLLSACLDRDLTFEQEADLRAHLRSCSACAEEMAALERVQGLLQGLPETDPGDGFFAAVQARIAKAEAGGAPEPARPSFWESLRGLLDGAVLKPAAGVAFGLVLGFVLAQGFPGGETPLDAPGGLMPIASREGAVTPAPAGMESPVADIPLPDLHASADSLAGESEEYILDPYEADAEHGIVPQGMNPGRTVSNRDGQGYITTF